MSSIVDFYYQRYLRWIHPQPAHLGLFKVVTCGLVPLFHLVAPGRIELPTRRFSVYRSTTELQGHLFWWFQQDLNLSPSACRADALPNELWNHSILFHLFASSSPRFIRTASAKSFSLCMTIRT